MNIIKRWTTSLSASFENVMSQVENHDALVSSALREMQSAGSKAKVQLERVHRDGENMERRISELLELERLWDERAVRIAMDDRDKGIECLRRRKQAGAERELLQKQAAEHRRIAETLGKDLAVIKERVAELKRKQSTMNARQYRAEALKAGQLSELGVIGEIDEIFYRWEVQVGEYEIFNLSGADRLEEQLIEEESQRELSAELDELLLKQSAK